MAPYVLKKREMDSEARGYYIVVDHGNGYATLYQHLSRQDVRTGDMVKAGQQIGAVGETGISTAPHLHFFVSWAFFQK